MALKLKISASDYAKLTDAKKEEYILQEDGSYKLDVDDLPDTAALQRALEHERANHKTTKARQKEIDDKLAELEAANAVKNRDVDALTKLHEKKIGETQAAFEARIAKRDSFIKTTLIDSVASKIAGKISTAPELLLPHIVKRMQVDFEGDEPVTVILDKDGKASKMTTEELSAEFVANKNYAAIIRASAASGSANAGKPAGRAAGASLPSSTEPVNLSKLSAKDMVAHIAAKKAAEA